jgi:hypothetical protein
LREAARKENASMAELFLIQDDRCSLSPRGHGYTPRGSDQEAHSSSPNETDADSGNLISVSIPR